MKVVNVEEMRRIEKLTDAAGHSYANMMEMAGRSVADAALSLGLLEPEDSALVLVGPGNNGGDGLVAARFLRQAGHDVVIYIWKRDVKHDENFRLLKRRRRGIAILWAENDPDFAKLREEVNRASVVIDALLGTGVDRPLDDRLGQLLTVAAQEIAERRRIEQEEEFGSYEDTLSRLPLLEAMLGGSALRDPASQLSELDSLLSPPAPPGLLLGDDDDIDEGDEDDEEDDDFWLDADEGPAWPPAPVLAVDCPSGLNCDTGEIDPRALHADVTVTFAYPKWGQLQFPGAEACGLLYVADIGVPPTASETITTELIGPDLAHSLLPARPAGAHKGAFGKALVVGGSLDYTGAIVLSAAAALRAGAGLVTAAVPRPVHAAVAGVWPELTWLALAAGEEGTHCAGGVARLLDRAASYGALLVGPGMTAEGPAVEFMTGLLAALDKTAWQGRAIFDADGLNVLATLPEWWGRLPAGSVLTPHPGEMGRLTGRSTGEVNARRIETARTCSREWGHIVLLKGPYSVVAGPDGRVGVVPFATGVLATAGSGDVLAGIIAGLMAQGLPAFEAALLGAYVHGFAGNLIATSNTPRGATASDILGRIPEALTKLAARVATP